MKSFNYVIVILMLFTLAACQSQYGSRMVRVKSQPKTELKSPIAYKYQPQHQDKELVHSEGTIASQKKDAKVYARAIEEKKVPEKVHSPKPKHIIPDFKTRYIDVEPLDSVPATEPNEEFVKEQYKKANKMTFFALALLVISPYTILLSLIGSVILSLKALKIYRAYKNPGVTERYVLAYTVLILSFLVILFSFGILYILAVL